MIGNKLAPVCTASAVPFQDIIVEPPSTGTEPCLFNLGDVLYLRDSTGTSRPVGAAGGLTGILSLGHGGTGADLSTSTANSALVKLTNKVADGASAVAFALDNATDLATAGAKLVSFRSAGTEKAAVRGDGGLLAPSAELTIDAPLPAATHVAIGGNLDGFAIRKPSGGRVSIGDLGGASTTQTVIYAASFTLATNETKDFTLLSQGGSAVIADDGGSIVATIGISRTATTTTGGLTYANFSTTLTTANKLNVNASGGLLRFENKTAGTLNIAVTFTFWRSA